MVFEEVQDCCVKMIGSLLVGCTVIKTLWQKHTEMAYKGSLESLL